VRGNWFAVWAGPVMAWLLVTPSVVCCQPPAARPPRETVVLTMDPQVVRTLAAGEACFAEQRWDAGLDLLLELLDRQPVALTRIPEATTEGLQHYGSVALRCQVILCRLPSAGLERYRERVNSRAEAWWQEWEATEQAEPLEKILRFTFASRYGDDALWTLGELAWQKGDFDRARSLWTRLLPLPPGVGDEQYPLELRYPDAEYAPADVKARLVLCSALSGQPERADIESRAFAREFPDEIGSLGGEEDRLATRLEVLLADFQAKPTSFRSSPTTVTYAGTPQRQPVPEERVAIQASVWSTAVPEWNWGEPLELTGLPGRQPLKQSALAVGHLVFYTEGQTVYGRDLFTGEPAWGANEGRIYPPFEPTPPDATQRPLQTVPHFSLTHSRGRLLARLGSPVCAAARGEFRDLPQELVCLDVQSRQGQLLWQVASTDLPSDGPPWLFEGTPLVLGERVYVVVCRPRPQWEWQVLCLDFQTGEQLWQAPICTARPTLAEDVNRIAQLLLTAGGGRLFFSTDFGAIVALDPGDGHVIWATTYESDLVPGERLHSRDWSGPLPVVFHHDRILVAPRDSRFLLCLQADSGRLEWSRLMPERLRSLVGVAPKGRLGCLVAGGKSLWGYDVETGQTLWTLQSSSPALQGYGRGTFAGNLLYWPTRQCLWTIDPTLGTILQRQHWSDLSPVAVGGNLWVHQQRLIVSGPGILEVLGPDASTVKSAKRPLSEFKVRDRF